MKQVFFIADDFGLTEAVNQAVIRAHQDGVLTGASLMMGQPATDHAVSLAKAHPTLNIGWHVHLCDSQPTTCERWPWNGSPFAASSRIAFNKSCHAVLSNEIFQQWRLYLDTGLRCEFVNAHHHLHVHPMILRELSRVLPAGFRGWLRGFNVRLFGRPRSREAIISKLVAPFARRWLGRTGFRTSDTLWGLDRLFRMNAGEVREAIAHLPEGWHEFVFHPRGGETDADLKALLELRTGAT